MAAGGRAMELVRRDMPSISLTYLMALCHERFTTKSGFVVPFDDGVFEARIVLREALLVGVYRKPRTMPCKAVKLFLEQRNGTKTVTRRFDAAARPMDKHGSWFEIDSPPDLGSG